MILRMTVKKIRVTLTIARIAKVIGVNSELEDGKHILMWDFDDVLLPDICQDLRRVQTRYLLSDIHICRTKEPTEAVTELGENGLDLIVKTPATYGNYIAYCFSSQDWKTAVEIVAQTHLVDWQFLRFGVYRSHFTLRVTPKNEREIKLAHRLEGYELPDCKPSDLKSWVRYETLSWR